MLFLTRTSCLKNDIHSLFGIKLWEIWSWKKLLLITLSVLTRPTLLASTYLCFKKLKNMSILFPCSFNRSSLTSTGSGTPVSSEYNTSDSDSECEFRQFQVQPLPPASTLQSSNNTVVNDNSRPFSLIFTRLTKIESEHRDELVCCIYLFERYVLVIVWIWGHFVMNSPILTFFEIPRTKWVRKPRVYFPIIAREGHTILD